MKSESVKKVSVSGSVSIQSKRWKMDAIQAVFSTLFRTEYQLWERDRLHMASLRTNFFNQPQRAFSDLMIDASSGICPTVWVTQLRQCR
jgi:hypothetical protein